MSANKETYPQRKRACIRSDIHGFEAEWYANGNGWYIHPAFVIGGPSILINPEFAGYNDDGVLKVANILHMLNDNAKDA